MGSGTSANVEINLATQDPAICAELQQWFDDLWADQTLTKDVKKDVLDALARIGQDYAPERIYYKMRIQPIMPKLATHDRHPKEHSSRFSSHAL